MDVIGKTLGNILGQKKPHYYSMKSGGKVQKGLSGKKKSGTGDIKGIPFKYETQDLGDGISFTTVDVKPSQRKKAQQHIDKHGWAGSARIHK